MKALFTIHAGEVLVGEQIEKKYGRRVRVWVPCKDTGVDLLVTDTAHRKTVSLQAKYSRDFLLTHLPSSLHGSLRAWGWWTIDSRKLAASPADYWVFAIIGSKRSTRDFIIIRPSDLLKRLTRIHAAGRNIQTYLSVTESNRCWESRGLTRDEKMRLANNQFTDEARDFSQYLNNWDPIAKLAGT